jgi:transposase
MLERRRMRAADLLLSGVSQAEVARRLGISRTTVHEWNKRLRSTGRPGLRSGIRGRPAGLDARQRARLARLLRLKRQNAGAGRLPWTLAEIVELVEAEFGHRYSRSQVSRILRSF